MSFLLDTNVISEIRKRHRADANVVRWVLATPADRIFTSVVVLAEIQRGIALKRRHDPAQAAVLDRWYAGMRTGLDDRVLAVSEPIADRWSGLGLDDPLPLVDALLAATALVHGLVMVTRNVADFSRTGVRLLNPFAAETA